ncbi:sugar transport-related sRNA regulator [Nitzschia inconspicua]|uniref:Sugar transport-related sRNA regulator n=1 Tax=Nitzschia inconspicua TaxID=303405 RepID=A0A9K3PUK1_9STRA|nr:sugar transport-related sRNA regulator [Nitzschia inconspicua]
MTENFKDRSTAIPKVSQAWMLCQDEFRKYFPDRPIAIGTQKVSQAWMLWQDEFRKYFQDRPIAIGTQKVSQLFAASGCSARTTLREMNSQEFQRSSDCIPKEIPSMLWQDEFRKYFPDRPIAIGTQKVSQAWMLCEDEFRKYFQDRPIAIGVKKVSQLIAASGWSARTTLREMNSQEFQRSSDCHPKLITCILCQDEFRKYFQDRPIAIGVKKVSQLFAASGWSARTTLREINSQEFQRFSECHPKGITCILFQDEFRKYFQDRPIAIGVQKVSQLIAASGWSARTTLGEINSQEFQRFSECHPKGITCNLFRNEFRKYFQDRPIIIGVQKVSQLIAASGWSARTTLGEMNSQEFQRSSDSIP